MSIARAERPVVQLAKGFISIFPFSLPERRFSMQKQNLTEASRELFRRSPDERFASLDDLWRHCHDFKDRSADRWHSPAEIRTAPSSSRLDLMRVLAETFPQGGKPMQVLTLDRAVRSIHGASYTRLNNLDLLAIVKEFGTDFQPPQTGMNGATGLYCGEQDMFVFLIDPTGWAEIEGEAFAPGFFMWNSEVGRRSVGVQTFWFQAVCQNHIVWDAVEVVDFSRKHTAKVSDSLSEIRRIIAQLVERRDERRDGFTRVMKKAFETRLGDNAEDVAKVLFKHGIPRDLAKQALAMAERQGRFTIFSLVDALTRISGQYENAGDRLEAEADVPADAARVRERELRYPTCRVAGHGVLAFGDVVWASHFEEL
jgi:hypothetical protein